MTGFLKVGFKVGLKVNWIDVKVGLPEPMRKEKIVFLKSLPKPMPHVITHGVGIRTSLLRGTGPLLKQRVARAQYLLSRVRGAQGGFSRRTRIIATLVQSAALWGSRGQRSAASSSRAWRQRCSKAYGGHPDRDGPKR